jgi:hypothetical protein
VDHAAWIDTSNYRHVSNLSETSRIAIYLSRSVKSCLHAKTDPVIDPKLALGLFAVLERLDQVPIHFPYSFSTSSRLLFTMKGVIFESVGAQPKVVDNLEKPKPSPDQILVKSLCVAINPVYGFCSPSPSTRTELFQGFLHEQHGFSCQRLAIRPGLRCCWCYC